MKNAFDANVPKRKPRTRLRGILDEIDSESNEQEAVVTPHPATQHRSAAPQPADPPPPRTTGPEARAADTETRDDAHAAESEARAGAGPAQASRSVVTPLPDKSVHVRENATPEPTVREAVMREAVIEDFEEPADSRGGRAHAGSSAEHAAGAGNGSGAARVRSDEAERVERSRVEGHELERPAAPSSAVAGHPAREPARDSWSASDGVASRESVEDPARDAGGVVEGASVSPIRPERERPLDAESGVREERDGGARADALLSDVRASAAAPPREPASQAPSPLDLIREPLARALGNMSGGARSASGESTRAPSGYASPSADLAPSQARPRAAAPGADVVLAGRARIAELRARLQSSAKRREVHSKAEPAVTAVRIRETMSALRGEVREMAEERTRLIDALELTRRELAEAEKALEAERRMRESSDQLAEERQEVAENLLAESEALAEERDEALARIVELRELDSQQVELVEDMQRQLSEHEEALQAALGEVSEVRSALEAAEEELCAVQARLDARNTENERLRARINELESEMQATASARDALLEIQKLVDTLG